jgi:hypothetical protein
MYDSELNDFGGNVPPLKIPPCFRVKQEGMIAAVPSDIYKPDQGAVIQPCCHPAETMSSDSVPPSRHGLPTVRVGKSDKFRIGEATTPRVLDTQAFGLFHDENKGG